MSEYVYLDYNASAPMRFQAIDIVNRVMGDSCNASSVHMPGRKGRKIIEDAREKIAHLAGTSPSNVIFNSGATEANNTVIKYFSDEKILISAIEHPSVMEATDNAGIIPVNSNGVINLQALENLLAAEPQTALVSVMYVNNETGVIQPIKTIVALAKKYGALVHCDASQAAGRIALDINAYSIDFLTLSAHKIGGPQGVGALIMGICGITPLLLIGGGQEKRSRAGTENIAGIAGFGVAAQLAYDNLVEYDQRMGQLKDKLETGLKNISPEIIIHGEKAPSVANTVMFSLPNALSEIMLIAFDLDGIAISNGSACSSGTVHSSHVLKAMGASDAEISGALRVSMGHYTTDDDIIRFLEIWSKIYSQTKNDIYSESLNFRNSVDVVR